MNLSDASFGSVSATAKGTNGWSRCGLSHQSRGLKGLTRRFSIDKNIH